MAGMEQAPFDDKNYDAKMSDLCAPLPGGLASPSSTGFGEEEQHSVDSWGGGHAERTGTRAAGETLRQRNARGKHGAEMAGGDRAQALQLRAVGPAPRTAMGATHPVFSREDGAAGRRPPGRVAAPGMCRMLCNW
jgi:hypothetical protein